MATNKKEYNNIFNQGVEAALERVERFRLEPKKVVAEDKTEKVEPLTGNQVAFNLLVDQFKAKIREALK
jgi:hypothetical protein